MASYIGRRKFLTTLLGGAATWPLAARAQQSAMPVVGVLYGVSAADRTEHMTAVRRGLSETGFVEGCNVAIEYRWAEGQLDRMAWMAADLIGRRVAVILIGGNTTGVRAMIAATQSIPIVFTTGVDPLAAGLVASLNRPGGNATGVTTFAGELGPKKLELLHEVVPTVKKIAVLVNPTNRVSSEGDVSGAQMAAHRLGLEIIVVNGGTEKEIEIAFASAVQQGAGAMYVGGSLVGLSRRQQFGALTLRHKLPTISSQPDPVRAGQLISYGANESEMYRQAGIYVGRILQGEKPADLPVQAPTKFELVINLKTARALGIEIPPTVLARADEVIE
jgi:putative tryptophan/tyrosine transport system substrate-binding protein